MTLTQERRAELEAAALAKLEAALEENLPMIRARLEEMTRSKSRRRAAEARRLLDRLDADYGPDPQHSQS